LSQADRDAIQVQRDKFKQYVTQPVFDKLIHVTINKPNLEFVQPHHTLHTLPSSSCMLGLGWGTVDGAVGLTVPGARLCCCLGRCGLWGGLQASAAGVLL